jgi:hypothetical protein
MYYFLIAAKLQNNYELRGMNQEKRKKRRQLKKLLAVLEKVL